MFDFDAGKLLIIGVVALIVIGPKDLPRVLRQAGQAVSRLRRMASEFQGQFMDAMKEADLQDIRDEVTKLKSHGDLKVNFDPVRDIRKEITQAVETRSEPLSVEAPPAATEGFTMPPLPVTEPETETASLASAGFAPVVSGNETDAVAASSGKRKIVVARRSGPAASRVDLTSGSRFRNVRPRRPETSQS